MPMNLSDSKRTKDKDATVCAALEHGGRGSAGPGFPGPQGHDQAGLATASVARKLPAALPRHAAAGLVPSGAVLSSSSAPFNRWNSPPSMSRRMMRHTGRGPASFGDRTGQELNCSADQLT